MSTPTLYSRPTTATYGFTSLPADQSKTSPTTQSPAPVKVSDIPIPSSPLATRINAYAKRELNESAYLHSLRVFSYGCAIARTCFPDWHVDVGGPLEETWFCCAILHDIGTTDQTLPNTRLSYEFWAGVKALEILKDSSRTQKGGEGDGGRVKQAEATTEQAESVAEAILRHQDVQDKGRITLLTRLIHLGTLLDNIGAGAELVHPETIENVNREYSRISGGKGWGGCFRDVVEREKREKPYAMVSRIEGFEGAIMGNEVTAVGKGQ